MDGRVKPDVLAPGEFVISTKSDGNANSHTCSTNDLVSMQGTSMATPLAAGAVSLVREYYMKGFYPSGVANEADSMSPSAALVKATAIHGGVAIGGTVVAGKTSSSQIPVTAPPSYLQGYGRMQLGASLYFAPGSYATPNTTTLSDVQTPFVEGWKTFVDDASTLGTGDKKEYCFRVAPKPSSVAPAFRATLVWTDSPPSATAAVILVNNLDLFASNVNTNETYIGNNVGFTDSNHTRHLMWDEVNNVEQVTLGPTTDATGEQLFYVRVFGKSAPVGSQRYALVVSGVLEKVDNDLCSAAAKCPDNCSGRGTCAATGRCNCDTRYSGATCSVDSAAMIDNSAVNVQMVKSLTFSGTARSDGWSYSHFDVTQEDVAALASVASPGLRVSMSRTSGSGDPDLFVDYERYPTVVSNRWSSTECEPCGKHSSVFVPSSSIRVGRYYVGVFGYCCDDSAYTVVAELGNITPPASQSVGTDGSSSGSLPLTTGSTPLLLIAFACLVLVALFSAAGYIVRRSRTHLPPEAQEMVKRGQAVPAFTPLQEVETA